MSQRILVLCLVSVAALLLACGGGARTTPTTAPASVPAAVAVTAAPAPTAPPAGPARIGERVEAGGLALTVVSFDRKAELGQFQKAKADNTFVVAEVLIENVSRDTAPYNPLYFKIKDGTGVEYNAALIVEANSLKSGELPRGDQVRGLVAFEAPASAAGLVLRFEPIVIGGGYEPIRVALGK